MSVATARPRGPSVDERRLAVRRRARVLLVGVGGLGAPAALALAAAGVGTLGLADDDPVELSNLHRQILFDEADVGRPKVEATAAALARLAPNVTCEMLATRLLPSNARELVARYDLVVEGSDNFATKFLTSDACFLEKRPVVHGAAVRWVGTALAVGAEGSPCYRCVFEDVPRENAPNCAEAGVVGPMVGVVGAILADLGLALLDGEPAFGRLVRFDGRTSRARTTTVAARSDCSLCGRTAQAIRSIDPERYVVASCG